jgi:hypothetical protein
VTSYDVDDVSALPDLLDQIERPVGSVTAGGAHDRDPLYDKALREIGSEGPPFALRY